LLNISCTLGFYKASTESSGCAPPATRVLEDEEENLEGAEKVGFLCFLHKILCWSPAARVSAKELLKDAWLRDVPK
jgi:uncharacterized protein Smg (DUF494 family)